MAWLHSHTTTIGNANGQPQPETVNAAVGGEARTHVLQAGAVLVLVEVVALPEAQQVVEVVEQAAGVLLCVLLLAQGVQVEGQLGPPPGQHQDDQAGVETAHVLLEEEVGRRMARTMSGRNTREQGKGGASVHSLMYIP